MIALSGAAVGPPFSIAVLLHTDATDAVGQEVAARDIRIVPIPTSAVSTTYTNIRCGLKRRFDRGSRPPLLTAFLVEDCFLIVDFFATEQFFLLAVML